MPAPSGEGGKSRLKWPNLLLGREHELRQLLIAAEDADDQARVVFIGGNSGTGKSYLVEKFREELLQKKPSTYFIEGKFEEGGCADPFATLASAFSGFCSDLLDKESSDTLKTIREQLLEVVGKDVQGLQKAIPPLSQILPTTTRNEEASEHSALTRRGDVAMQAAAHQLKYQFMSFLEAVCSKDRPIVLFLDDLHWADEASLQLLASILTNAGLYNFVIVGTYRDNEIDKDHELAKLIDRLHQSGSSYISIHIGNLGEKVVGSYVAQSLDTDHAGVEQLNQVLFSQTKGNILHTRVALMVLEQKKILNYSYITHKWEWDVDRILKQISMSENVVDTSIERLKSLPDGLRLFLRTASFLGSSFDTSTIVELVSPDALTLILASSEIVDSSPGAVVKRLDQLCDEAISAWLLQKLPEQDESGKQRYRFAHDRIREAAHSFPTTAELDAEKYRIGSKLLELSSTIEGEEWMYFTGLDYLNSLDNIEEKIETLHLVDHNYQAANMAVSRSDFISASGYLEWALRYLSSIPERWTSHYVKCLEVNNMKMKVDVCIGRFAKVRDRANEIFANAQASEDKLEAYNSLAEGLGYQSLHKEAVDVYTEASKILSYSIPRNFVLFRALSDVRKLQKMFSKKSDEEILSMPIIQDPNVIMKIRIVTEMITRAYFARETYLSVLCMTRAVLLTLKHGLSGPGCFAFAACGSIFAGILKDLQLGVRLGHLATSMLKLTLSRDNECLVLLSVSVQIDAWVEPLRKTQETLMRAYLIGMETGDTEFGLQAAVNYQVHSFMLGIPLGPILDEMAYFLNQIEQFGNESAGCWALPINQMWMCLAGRIDPGAWLDSVEDTLVESRDVEPSEKTKVIWSMISQGIVAYHFRRYEFAEKCWAVMMPHAEGIAAYYTPLLTIYYHGLISAARFRETGKRRYRQRAKKATEDMKTLVNRHSSGLNDLHCYYIMRADCVASFGGKGKEEVKQEFNQAISFSSRAGFVQDAALVNELCGEHFFRKCDTFWAKHYLTTAYELYGQWGAAAKTRFLERVRESCVDTLRNGDVGAAQEMSTTMTRRLSAKIIQRQNSSVTGSEADITGSSTFSQSVEKKV